MAETSLSDEVRSASLPTEAQPTPTPLQGLTNSLGLLPAYMGAGAKEVSGIRESVGRQRAESADFGAAAAANKQAAESARPDAVKLPPVPSLAARPFLAPGEGMLAQLQTAILGATQMALGVGGLKGGGHAIAAVAGLKGALEGWIAGDHDRANSALKEWDANSQKLLEEHRTRREAYLDMMTDRQTDMTNRLAQIGINARIDGRIDLANAAERQQLGDVLTILTSSEQHERDFTVKIATLRDSIARHQQTEARMERDHADLQRQRNITNQRAAASSARAERGLKLREETSKAVVTLQGQETALAQKLENAGVVREAVDLLDKEGILPKGATVWDTAKAKLALQSKPGRADIAQAVQVIQRLGTPLVIGTEVGLGTTGSALRLKVVGEAEAGNLLGAPKQFWDLFLPMAEKKWAADRAIARQHLERLGRLPPGEAEPEILFKDE